MLSRSGSLLLMLYLVNLFLAKSFLSLCKQLLSFITRLLQHNLIRWLSWVVDGKLDVLAISIL